MTSDSKGVALPLLLVCLCVGFASEGSAGSGDSGVIPGSKFGTLGLDYRFSSGSLFAEEKDYVLPIEPVFRAGTSVFPGIVIGAELALLWTFPTKSNLFFWTPSFSFGPMATWLAPRQRRFIQPYASAGGGLTYHTADLIGWRVKMLAGAAFVTSIPVAPGIEAGWHHDWLKFRYSGEVLTGNTFFLGLRVTGFR